MTWNILAGQSVAFALTIVVSVLITMGIIRVLRADLQEDIAYYKSELVKANGIADSFAREIDGLRAVIANAEEWSDIAEDYVCQIRELRAEIARLEAKKGEQ